MKVNSICSGLAYNTKQCARVKMNEHKNTQLQANVSQAPNFKGSEVGKIAGTILGTITITMLCPPLAAIGGAGIGALTGLIMGDAVDQKIDEASEKNSKSANGGKGNNEYDNNKR